MTTLSLLHPTDVLAIEVRETLERRPELWHTLRLLSDDADEVGTLADIGGAAAMVAQLDDDALAETDIALIFGSAETAERALERLPATTRAIVVASEFATTTEAGAGAGSGDRPIPLVAGVDLEDALARDANASRFVSPHPAIVGLTQVLAPLRDFGLRGVYGTVHLPGSGWGREGLDELFAQARDLLSFQPVKTEILPTQLAFNLVAAEPGIAASASTVRQILGRGDLPLALQTLQGAIFHGIGLSLVVDLAEEPAAEQVRERLGESPWIDLAVDPELLGTIDSANREEVVVGTVDARGGSLYGLWAVLDNLTRGGALNAVAILEALLGHTDA